MEQNGLTALTSQLVRDHEILAYPHREWVRPRLTSSGQNILDCLIIGGGQSGLGIAKGLLLDKVSNILVVDENSPGQEGPWLRFARMPHLRTPKHLTGLDFGNPNLTFYAYFVARYGKRAYDELNFIPTTAWADYLAWYRESQAIPVENHTRAHSIRYDHNENCLAINFLRPHNEGLLFARTVVLANGIDGCGAWHYPPIITENLPRERYAHTCENIDFSSLKNLRIGIIGAGASAFDNALMALAQNARSVHLFSRRKELPNVNPYRWAEFVGFLKHHGDLDDEMRWRFISQIIETGQLPPKTTLDRALRYENFHLETAQSLRKVSLTNNDIIIETEKAHFQFDFVIVGTGLITDLSLRPELSQIHHLIARFGDRVMPPPELANSDLARHPYLGSCYQFQERTPMSAPYLANIFCYNFGSLVARGLSGGSISGLKYSLPRIVAGITRKLFLADREFFLEQLKNYRVPEYELEFIP